VVAKDTKYIYACWEATNFSTPKTSRQFPFVLGQKSRKNFGKAKGKALGSLLFCEYGIEEIADHSGRAV
jgi:hypothetical protein